MRIFYRMLVDEGFTQSDIDRVHSPVGLAIDAGTPEEIAVTAGHKLAEHKE